jgi:outer membrane biosynthesis protein TonB
MFDFIKNLFGGIFGFFGGLFGSKKSQDESGAPKPRKASGYYLQLDEAEEKQSVAAPQKASSQPAPEKKPEPAKAVATATAASPQPANVKPAKAEAKKPEPAKAEAKKPEAANAPAPAASTNGKVPQPQTEQTFAPRYLNPASATSNTRRRPGPSLSNFLDMARQVKTPNA